MSNTLVYTIEDAGSSPMTLYVNLTNKCTNACIFCIRNLKDDVNGKSLWLDNENFTADDVIEQFEKFETPKQIVFCGYGEPMLKFDILKQVAQYVRKNYPEVKIRLNTNGHANSVYNKNVVDELKDLVDEISVSLNADNAEDYDKISQPNIDNAFDEVKDFIKSSSDAGIKTVASVVDGFDGAKINVEACKKIAESLGAQLRVRPWLDNGY